MRFILFTLIFSAFFLTGCKKHNVSSGNNLSYNTPATSADFSPLKRPISKSIYAERMGIEIDGIGDGGRAKPFIDIAKTLREFMNTKTGKPAKSDEYGWPLEDAATVLFDIRPCMAWNPPIDDPDKFQPDWSGTYKCSFNGQADLSFIEKQDCKIDNQKYDTKNNCTTFDLIVPPGAGLCILSFTNSKLTGDSAVNTGIKNLRVIRPGYKLDTSELFTVEFLNSLRPFAVLRFMDWTETNHNPGYWGDPGHHALAWKDRTTPLDASQASNSRKYGASWEYAIDLANITGKDMWINIPVAATDDYVKKLAMLLKEKLKPELKVYVEHSNEVWNFGFPQYIYNKLAAIDDVKQGNSKLNNDGNNDQETWARRRHAKRLIEISEIMKNVMAKDTVRPVYASWVIFPKVYYDDVLLWVKNSYGDPKKYYYAIAGAAYFNIEGAQKNANVDQLIETMKINISKLSKNRDEIQTIADNYGVRHCQYESGPDTGGGSTENLANRIKLNRDHRMKELILSDMKDNWFDKKGDIYIYFSHCSAYSRYGCWGLSEDIRNVSTPKWQAIYELSGWKP